MFSEVAAKTWQFEFYAKSQFDVHCYWAGPNFIYYLKIKWSFISFFVVLLVFSQGNLKKYQYNSALWLCVRKNLITGLLYAAYQTVWKIKKEIKSQSIGVNRGKSWI